MWIWSRRSTKKDCENHSAAHAAGNARTAGDASRALWVSRSTTRTNAAWATACRISRISRIGCIGCVKSNLVDDADDWVVRQMEEDGRNRQGQKDVMVYLELLDECMRDDGPEQRRRVLQAYHALTCLHPRLNLDCGEPHQAAALRSIKIAWRLTLVESRQPRELKHAASSQNDI